MKSSVKNLMIAALLAVMFPVSIMAGNTVKGDVNGDGTVTIIDVTALIDHILTNTVDAVFYNNIDVNGDGNISILDVTSIIDYLLVGEWAQDDDVTITVNGVTFTMVLVRNGTFTMGATPEQLEVAHRDEYPAHEVTLTFDYYMGQTEVTQELWLAVMGNNPSQFQGDLNRPVENVSQFDCAIFVDKLTAMTGKIFRLPTEAEWEYAARGGNRSRVNMFAGSNYVDEVAWYVGNANSSTQPVASLAPNELGLYDMSGNVFEWCQDWYVMYDSEPQTNPCGPESGVSNVYRGGAWMIDASGCRVSYRGHAVPQEKSDYVGLRLVMNAE